MKEVKYHDSHRYSVALENANRQALKLKEVTQLIQSVTNSTNIKTAIEFDAWLNSKTGFQNASFSASSLDLQDAYKQIKRLNAEVKISLDDVNTNFKLKADYKKALKDEHSTYYSSDEIATKERLEKVVLAFNSLSNRERSMLLIGRDKNLIYNRFLNPY